MEATPEITVNDPRDGDLAGSRKRRREHIAALLITHGFLAMATILAMGFGEGVSYEFSDFLVMSVAVSQGSLVGIWVAFGGRATPWRLIGATVGLIGCMWCLEKGLPDSEAHYWPYFLLAQTVGTSLPLVLLRFCGLGIIWHAPGSPAPKKQKLQFSIRALMQWTVAVAVLLGTLPMTPEDFRTAFTSDTFEVYGLFGASVLLMLFALWTALGTRWPMARILALGLALAAAVAGTAGLFPPTVGHGILFHLFCAFWLIGSLWVLRRAGYRLAWRGSVRL